MAQTRATSKALRLTLGFVMAARRLRCDPGRRDPGRDRLEPRKRRRADECGKIPADRRPTADQKARIGQLLVDLRADPDVDWKAEARAASSGVHRRGMLTATSEAMLIGKLKEKYEELAA